MEDVLSCLKPSWAERRRFTKVISEFLVCLNKELDHAKAILGGSGAKDTWLAQSHDVDIFVLFEQLKQGRENLSDFLQVALRKAFPQIHLERIHGSRDYFQLVFQGFHVEVVPLLRIKNVKEAQNITDISPLHTLWVNKHARGLKDEIRLAKQFFKAQGLYGAESHIKGFSGYVLEILIVYYGSFIKLLKGCLQWRKKLVIDVAKHYSKKDPFFYLNKSKIQSPLIVVDPVDSLRNASAALSWEKCSLLQKRAREYLKKPSSSFFQKKLVDLVLLQKETLRKKGVLLVVDVVSVAGKVDVVGVKLLKIFEFLEKALQPFTVLKAGWEWEKSPALFYFLVGKEELPSSMLRVGPPLSMSEAVSQFKKKNKDVFVQKGKIWARVPLHHPKAVDFFSDLLSQPYVQEKVVSVKIRRLDP